MVLRTTVTLIGAILLVAIIFSGFSEAHNINVVVPAVIAVDIGDMMRWVSNNPDANLSDPKTYIQFIVYNASDYYITFAAKASYSSPYIASISCPTTVYINPASLATPTCTIELNVVEKNTKLFTGPYIEIPVKLEINILRQSDSSLLNRYEENVVVLVTDTNDGNWTLVLHYDDNGETITKYALSQAGYDDTKQICYKRGAQSTLSPTSTICLKPNCYSTLGSVVDINLPNVSNYSRCVLTFFINYPCTARAFTLNRFYDTMCLGEHASNSFPGGTGWKAMTLSIPLDANVVSVVLPSCSYEAKIDEVRLWCMA